MADRAWTEFFDEVLPKVPKAPRQYAANCIRDSARDVCARGRVYQLESDAINIVANQKEYAWVKAGYTNVEVTELAEVFYNGLPLELPGREGIKREYAPSNWRTEKGTPRFALRLLPADVRLVPYPDADLTGGLVIAAFVKPTLTATGIIDKIGDTYRTLISKGAIARLAGTPGPYFNASLAAQMSLDFEAGLPEAAFAAETGDADSDLDGSLEYL